MRPAAFRDSVTNQELTRKNELIGIMGYSLAPNVRLLFYSTLARSPMIVRTEFTS